MNLICRTGVFSRAGKSANCIAVPLTYKDRRQCGPDGPGLQNRPSGNPPPASRGNEENKYIAPGYEESPGAMYFSGIPLAAARERNGFTGHSYR